MGIVRAIQKGEADPSDFNKDAQDAAKKMKKSSVKKYAKTKHKGLPTKKVSEGKLETLALNLLRNINKEIGISKYDHTKTAHFNKVMKFLRSKMPKAPDRKLGDIAMSYGDYRKKQPKATIPDIDSVKDMEKTLKSLGMKESVNEAVNTQQANILMKQLGGRRFEMMMGVKSKAIGKDGLILHIGKNPKGVSHIIIDYDRGSDLYNIRFGKIRMNRYNDIKKLKGIAVDQLDNAIEKNTGLYTRF